MSKVLVADRGRSLELDCATEDVAGNPTWAVASRLGRLRIASPARSVWLQVRGCCRVESPEGSFLLRAGEWISFASGSQPELQSERGGLTLGLALPSTPEHPMPAHRYQLPLVGRGAMPRRQLRLTMRIWRQAVVRAQAENWAATRLFLLHFSHSQQELLRQLSRCPGRSLRQKTGLYEALQRIRLYLEGNSHRTVRVSELAAMAGYSTWYLSKTFRCVYGATPQSIASRYRLDRARHLLTNTSLAINEVGALCGFSSHATFARAFRSGHGTTASGYRCSARRIDEKALQTRCEIQTMARP